MQLRLPQSDEIRIVRVSCASCRRAFRTVQWVAETRHPSCPVCKCRMDVSAPEGVGSLARLSHFKPVGKVRRIA
jgi:hypothetical protein